MANAALPNNARWALECMNRPQGSVLDIGNSSPLAGPSFSRRAGPLSASALGLTNLKSQTPKACAKNKLRPDARVLARFSDR